MDRGDSISATSRAFEGGAFDEMPFDHGETAPPFHGSLERVFFGERDPGNAPERGFAFNSGDVAFNRFSGAHALRDDCIQKLLEGEQ